MCFLDFLVNSKALSLLPVHHEFWGYLRTVIGNWDYIIGAVGSELGCERIPLGILE